MFKGEPPHIKTQPEINAEKIAKMEKRISNLEKAYHKIIKQCQITKRR